MILYSPEPPLLPKTAAETLADLCVIPQLFASPRFGIARYDLTALSSVERAHPSARPDPPVPPT